MNNKILWVFIAIFLTIAVKAQDCDFYYPEMKGAELTYKNFDRKGKFTGTSTQQVTEYSKTASGATATIHVKSADDKGGNVMESDLHVKCENGIFYFDMNSFLNQPTQEGMQAKIEYDNLQMPANLKIGDKLKDGWIKMSMMMGPMAITSEIIVTNRIVEKKESVTTDAGTFDCYKITQTVITRGPIKYEQKSSQWLTKGTGVIKNESYASDGSIFSSMILSQIKK